jgi:hypothetical protein
MGLEQCVWLNGNLSFLRQVSRSLMTKLIGEIGRKSLLGDEVRVGEAARKTIPSPQCNRHAPASNEFYLAIDWNSM